MLYRRLPKDQQETASKRFDERLLNPDFAVLEAHFRCPMSKELKELYENKEEILRNCFDVIANSSDTSKGVWFVAIYEPADAEAIRFTWPGCEGFFAFADDGCGNRYLIDPRKSESEVLFYQHETRKISRVGLSLSEFLTAPRRIPDD